MRRGASSWTPYRPVGGLEGFPDQARPSPLPYRPVGGLEGYAMRNERVLRPYRPVGGLEEESGCCVGSS